MKLRTRILRTLCLNLSVPAAIWFAFWLGYSVIAPFLVHHEIVVPYMDFYQS